MDTGNNSLKVLMFPWLAYGHISPYLDVAKKLASKGFEVYLCSTPINLSSIKKRKYPSIQLVELHLPDLPELPPHYHTTNGLPTHLNSTLKKALKLSKPNFSRILVDLKPDLLIYDVLQPWAKEVACSQNIAAVALLTCSAAVFSYFLHPLKQPADVQFPFPALYMTNIERERIQQMLAKAAEEKEPDDDDPFDDDQEPITMLMSTSRATEGIYIDYMAQLIRGKIILVGPPFQEPMNNDDDQDDGDLIDWLGKKDENSTVFVSFGSEYFLSRQDLEEVAFGLELSQVNFIWVVRFPKGEEVKVEEALPQGFLERIGDRGRVVDGWAPQRRILSHSSTGGFVSHCGWNSVMESIDFGVPIIAMPMQLDQPLNARLMVHLGVAVEIVRDDQGNVHREEVAKVIRSVICEGTGENLRKKVREMSENLKSVRGEEMDAAAQQIRQLFG